MEFKIVGFRTNRLFGETQHGAALHRNTLLFRRSQSEPRMTNRSPGMSQWAKLMGDRGGGCRAARTQNHIPQIGYKL